MLLRAALSRAGNIVLMPIDDLVTVRIPELPPVTDEVPLTSFDTMPVTQSTDNKTRHLTLSRLAAFFGTGGGGIGLPPVINGSRVIHDVTPAENGGTIVSIPSLANQSFTLERDGYPLKEGPDFEILVAGGFQLKIPGDVLVEGQRFALDVYTLAGGTPGGSPGGGGGRPLFTDFVHVDNNLMMTASNHLNKLMQIRAGSNIITVTLPDITGIPDFTPIVFESSLNNVYQTKIATQGGQYIYMRNNGFNEIFIGPGESIWLLKDANGFVVINCSGNFNDVGKIQASYRLEVGEVLADGSLLQRAQYPRLWQWVQGVASSLVSEAIWNTASVTVAGRTVPNPYRGCYSTGDGSTTFRVPNLMNVALRGLRTASGTDTERHANTPGGFQLDEVRSHTHSYARNNSQNNSDAGGNPDYVAQTPNGVTGAYGGTETRMMNTGILWTIKV